MKFNFVAVGTLSLYFLATCSALAGVSENLNGSKDLADFLQLTDEQRKEVEIINGKSIEKLQPIYEKIKELRKEADEIRKENMEQFIKILTPEQKKNFEGLYKESKKEKFLGGVEKEE